MEAEMTDRKNLFSRRRFIAQTGALAALPAVARAAAHSDHTLATANGTITVRPIRHASVILETPAGVIYVDPVGEPVLYSGMPPADLVLVTHEHGDHFNAELLDAVVGEGTALVTNPAVHGMLSADLQGRAMALANGESAEAAGTQIGAIPAYNLTAERMNFHPQGRDNGYVVTVDGARLYFSGDTEDIPEMRGLSGIDMAFVCMNLPFTMSAEQAASAVAEFAPGVVYPYHFRGRDDGTQDPEVFAALLAEAGSSTEVRIGGWYG